MLRNMMDVLLSLEGEYILSTRLGGQDASPRDKVGEVLQILDYPTYVTQIRTTGATRTVRLERIAADGLTSPHSPRGSVVDGVASRTR